MTNKKILIVEDDEAFLDIFKNIFTAEGFQVVTARDGETGIDVALLEKPDLIISDVLMPRLDGPSMAKKLRELKTSTPIIFLTNIDDEVGNAENIENIEYLIKSKMGLDEIVAKVKNKLASPNPFPTPTKNRPA